MSADLVERIERALIDWSQENDALTYYGEDHLDAEDVREVAAFIAERITTSAR